MRLSHKDYAALERTVYELYEFRDLKRFRAEVPAIFLKTFQVAYFSWICYRMNPAVKPQIISDYAESSPLMTPELCRRMGEEIMSHPFTEYFLGGGEQTALRLSDFLGTARVRKSNVPEVHRQWGIKYNMALNVAAPPGHAAAIALGNNRRDLSERDRLMLNLLRRHYIQAERNATLATGRSQEKVRPLVDFNLTPRELEVTRWLAEGKSNPEIAIILNISPRTIEKHVERILEKFGVENRSAAVIMICKAAHTIRPDSRG